VFALFNERDVTIGSDPLIKALPEVRPSTLHFDHTSSPFLRVTACPQLFIHHGCSQTHCNHTSSNTVQDEESELAARLDKMTPEEIDDLY
jgi:hypothetical protein